LLPEHPEQERNGAPFLALMIHKTARIRPLISPGLKVAWFATQISFASRGNCSFARGRYRRKRFPARWF